MNILKKFIVLSILATGLIGCAAPKMNLSIPIDPIEIAPKSDKALVYFIRPNNLGFKIHAAIYDDEKFVGFVPYNQKLPYSADPGEHTFMVVSEAADFMKANLLAGKTYYVQVLPRIGLWRARFSIAPISGDQLQNSGVRQWINDARLIKNNEQAYEWAKNNEDSVLKKKAAYLKKWMAKPEDQRPLLRSNDGE